jgi:hypothetical protein
MSFSPVVIMKAFTQFLDQFLAPRVVGFDVYSAMNSTVTGGDFENFDGLLTERLAYEGADTSCIDCNAFWKPHWLAFIVAWEQVFHFLNWKGED